MDYSETVDTITSWLKEQAREAGLHNAVIGVSGGVDSAVAAVLAQEAFGQNLQALILPCASDSQDAEDARKLTSQFRIDTLQFDTEDIYNLFISKFVHTSQLAAANLKARLRMCALYHAANVTNALVIGTTNRTEMELGYFTKYGDGGVDLEPIADLYKTEVFGLASYLGVPKAIITKPPSAGLWEGQTDEEEMGFTYEEIDRILQGTTEPYPIEIEARIKANIHKQNLAPTCILKYS